MNIGDLLIYSSIILSITGIITSLLYQFTKNEQQLKISRYISYAIFVTITLTLLYLYYLFITSDMSYYYVWTYSSTTHPLKYKLAGVLAGMAGSLLFWTWATIIPWFYAELKYRKQTIDHSVLNWARTIIFITITMFLSILTIQGLFEPTGTTLLTSTPNGQGLNPLLQTDLMVIHPPVVFLAYGFFVLPFAASFSNLITRKRDWLKLSLVWSRISWFFLTIGIGLGALWAYIVLGWGGYWGWDPVETSSLLPWLLLTGFLHIQLMNKRKKDYLVLAPTLGIFTFILVIFATFVTRAGGLWVSVHTFGQADINLNVWERFTTMIANNPTILIYLLFMIITILITSILALYNYKKLKTQKQDTYYKLSELINDEILMLFTGFLIILTTIITFLILIFSMNGYQPEEYNTKIGVLTLITILIMIQCLLWRKIGRKNIALLTAITLTASLISMLLYPQNIIIAGTTPILIIALIGTLYKIVTTINRKKIIPSLNITAAHLIHLAVILILIGYTTSNYLTTETNLTLELDGTPGSINDYTIYLRNIESSEQQIFITLEIHHKNNLLGTATPGLILINNQTRNEIKVIDTLTEDVYLIYQKINENELGTIENVEIIVKILPLMKFLWAGLWLMAAAMILRVLTSTKIKPTTQTSKKDKTYYENLFEKELQKQQ